MYSLVVPIYKNEENIADLLAAVRSMNEELGGSLEAVFVVDGSPDNSYQSLKDSLPDQPFASQLICLARNFGSFAAIRMGMTAAKGPYFAVMAADLQEPPQLVVEFFKTLSTEPVDLTIGVRQSRDDPWLSRTASNTYWRIYRRLIQKDMPPGGVDVFGCNDRVRQTFLQMEEANSTLVGLLFWMGFRRKLIPYDRRRRVHGKSAWTLVKKLRYMFDSAYAFSDIPIVLLLLVGAAGVCLSTAAGVVVFIAWLLGNIPIRGYAPLILVMLFSTSLILLSLGVVGGYVWRAFENTKGRPQFIPMSRESFGKDDAS